MNDSLVSTPRNDGGTHDTDANTSFNVISAADIINQQHLEMEEGEIPPQTFADAVHQHALQESQLIEDDEESAYYQGMQDDLKHQ